jgi:hypothetical protein
MNKRIIAVVAVLSSSLFLSLGCDSNSSKAGTGGTIGGTGTGGKGTGGSPGGGGSGSGGSGSGGSATGGAGVLGTGGAGTGGAGGAASAMDIHNSIINAPAAAGVVSSDPYIAGDVPACQ